MATKEKAKVRRRSLNGHHGDWCAICRPEGRIRRRKAQHQKRIAREELAER